MKVFGPSDCHAIIGGEIMNLAGKKINAYRSLTASTDLVIEVREGRPVAVENNRYRVELGEGPASYGREVLKDACRRAGIDGGALRELRRLYGAEFDVEASGLNSPYASHQKLGVEPVRLGPVPEAEYLGDEIPISPAVQERLEEMGL